MNEFEPFLDKLCAEKEEEKKTLLMQAQAKSKEILKEIETQAHAQYKGWLAKEQGRFLRETQAAQFDTKQRAIKKILEQKEHMLEVAFSRLIQFMKENPHDIPKKEVVTKRNKEMCPLNEEEVVTLIKEQYAQEIDAFFEP